MSCLVSLGLVLLLGGGLLRRVRLAWLAKVTLLHGWSSEVRTLGRTRFADPKAYHEARLTPQNRLEYFRDGFTVLPGALPAQVLQDLRRTLVAEFGEWNSAWSHHRAYDSDALLDFYVYSSLGGIAAQVFQSPGTETATEDPTAYLWRDFMYFRHPGKGLTFFHLDSQDCDQEALPPNATRGNRPRIWVPLDDGMWAPTFTNFSLLLEQLRDDEVRARFWRGELKTFHGHFKEELRNFSRPEDQQRMLLPPRRLRLGDVVLHVPCLMHGSPLQPYSSMKATLFPTYATASSKAWQTNRSIRTCQSTSGAAVTVDQDASCYVQAWPPEARPEPGSRRAFRHKGSVWQWLYCSLRADGIFAVSHESCHLSAEGAARYR